MTTLKVDVNPTNDVWNASVADIEEIACTEYWNERSWRPMTI